MHPRTKMPIGIILHRWKEIPQRVILWFFLALCLGEIHISTPFHKWSGHVSESNQYFWIQPPQGGNIPWNSNQNQGQNQWNGWALISNQYYWDLTPSRGNPPNGQVLGINQSSWDLTPLEDDPPIDHVPRSTQSSWGNRLQGGNPPWNTSQIQGPPQWCG